MAGAPLTASVGMETGEPLKNVKHVYSPLGPGYMRTLLLHRGEDDDPLVGTFEQRPMQGRSFDERYQRCETLHREDLLPEALCTEDGYDAISYVWGEPRFPHKLYIGGNGKIDITVSLFQALQRLRFPERPRRLWADAVCINQADTVEKAAQVTAMHTIYLRADNVLVWLGPENPEDALSFSLMHFYDIKETSNLDDDETLQQLKNEMERSHRCLCCGQVPRNHDTRSGEAALLAMTKLITRPWFFRVWVVQEMDHRLIIGRIFSGRHSAPITDFIITLSWLLQLIRDEKLPLTKQTSRVAIENTLQISHEYGGKRPTTRTFWNSFAAFSQRQCSDPRDRVYAIRSCLGLENLPGLVPDYTIDAAETFRRLTYTMLRENNFPDVGVSDREKAHSRTPWIPLSLVGTEIGQSQSPWTAPSWVPDLHSLTARSRGKLEGMTQAFSDEHELFSSSPRRFECKIDSDDNTRLHVRGRCFATLDTPKYRTSWPPLLLEDLSAADDNHVPTDSIVDWYRTCKQIASPALAHLNVLDAAELVHNLLLCRPRNFKPARKRILWQSQEKNLLAKLTGEWPSIYSQDLRPSISQFIHGFDRTHLDRGRVLCTIRNGKYQDVAWVPPKSQAGDRICVFGGAPFAYVLRPCSDGSFMLLGDAFTAAGTLTQALGGELDGPAARPSVPDWSMSWRTDNGEMAVLMDRLGWLTLT